MTKQNQNNNKTFKASKTTIPKNNNNKIIKNKNIPKKNDKIKNKTFEIYNEDDDVSPVRVIEKQKPICQIDKTNKNLYNHKQLRENTWMKYIGIINVYCFCCRTNLITPFNFECGHVVSAKNGGEPKVSNLRPICRECNGSMKTRHMAEFVETHGLWDWNT